MIKPINELSIDEMYKFRITHPLARAQKARGEYEIVKQVEAFGYDTTVNEFKMYPDGQNGIHVDWVKLKDLFYVPKAFIDFFIENDPKGEGDRSELFSHDDLNSFSDRKHDKDLVNKIIKLTGVKKLEKLREDSAWRKDAKRYSQHLLDTTIMTLVDPNSTWINRDYIEPVKSVLMQYKREMK